MWQNDSPAARSGAATIAPGITPDMTWAALIERFEREQPITDEMIRVACANMDAAQVYPFAAQIRGDA